MPTEIVDLTEDRQSEILIVAWVTTGAAFLTVATKLFTRLRVIRVVGWDDFFIVFSTILSITASSFVHYGVHLGFGRHTAAVMAAHGEKHLFLVAKYQMLGYPFNIGAFSFPNLAITILICQLLDPNPLRTRFLYSITILQVFFAMVTVVLAFLQCRPTQKLWEKALPGTCWSPNVLNYFSYWFCAFTTLTDLVLAIVPVVAFWKLQMKRSTKITLCVLMSMTLVSAIVTIIKGTYLHLFTDTIDPLYNPVPLVLWGLVEQNIVIMAACVPNLRPLFHRSWDRTTSRHRYSVSRPVDDSMTTCGIWQSERHVRVLSHKKTGVRLATIEQKNYAESADSQQGIMRTVEVSVQQGGNDERPISHTRGIVPQSLKDSQQQTTVVTF